MKPKIPRRIDFSFFFCWDYYCVTEVTFEKGTEHENGKRCKMELSLMMGVYKKTINHLSSGIGEGNPIIIAALSNLFSVLYIG